MKPTLLILAAGMGSRYGGLKQVDAVGSNGEAIMDFSIFDAIREGFGKVVFVIRESFAQDFKAKYDQKLLGKIEVEYVFQDINDIPNGFSINPLRRKMWGTAHAILAARKLIHENFVVINADDFYGRNSFKLLNYFFKKSMGSLENDYAMVAYKLKHTLSNYGGVSRGVCKLDQKSCLKNIVEHTQIERKEGRIHAIQNGKEYQLNNDTIISMNIWGFGVSIFKHLETYFKHFLQQHSSDLEAEFYIPSVVNELIKKSVVQMKVLESREEWFGVTYKEDKKQAVLRIIDLQKQGIYPQQLWN